MGTLVLHRPSDRRRPGRAHLLPCTEPALEPRLTAEQRSHAVRLFADDVARLEALLGRSFQDWLDTTDRGSFMSRAAGAQAVSEHAVTNPPAPREPAAS